MTRIRDIGFSGLAAAQCGKALSFRRHQSLMFLARLCLARQRRSFRISFGGLTLRKSLTALCCGQAATAKEQEERHPHSGPPALYGSALTTIISRAEEDPEQQSVSSKMRSQENIVHQPVAEIREGGDSVESDGNRPRKKSVTDVEFKSIARPRKKRVFGGWYRDESGKWTR